MADYKDIGSISVVTDTETRQEEIGDVQGGFDEYKLLDHVRSYGAEQLATTLTSMQWQVWEAVRKVNHEKALSEANVKGPWAG